MSDDAETRTDIRSFLTSRRARLSLEDAGLEDYGSRRRVVGLRRDEVARLANISVEYYTRLERGRVRGVSETVLQGIGDALRLTPVEREHFSHLVRRAVSDPCPARTESVDSLAPALPPQPVAQDVVDAITHGVAFIRDGYVNVTAANLLARRLYKAAGFGLGEPVNLARFIYLEPASRDLYQRWDRMADQTVGTLRSQSARHPDDARLRELIDDLSARSAEFRDRWARHEVQRYDAGIQAFHHPVVGDLELNYNVFDVRVAPDSVLVVYTATPGSPSAERLSGLTALPGTP